MATKIEAANVLMKAGIPMVICDGRRERRRSSTLPRAGRSGTMFAGGEGTLGARKLWIALGQQAAGEVVIDDGARDALVRAQHVASACRRGGRAAARSSRVMR